MRHGYRRHPDRWAVRQLRAPAQPPGEPDRPPRRDRHDITSCGVCRVDTASGADGPHRGRRECAPVVRVDVSHSKTRNTGVEQMKLRIAECGLRNVFASVVALTLIALPLAAQTSLSIYRDGRVVVRRTLPQALQQGRNALTLRLEALDPATLFSPDTSVSVSSATVRYPSTSPDALARAVGQTLSFVRSKGDTIRATVVRADPPQFKLSDGRLLLGLPGEPLFPAELVRTTPEAEVVLDAARARQRTDIAYVAQGMTWEALYQVIVTGARAQVTGTATVTSQSIRADSAEVQLVAGAIQRTRAAKSPAPAMDGIMMRAQAGMVSGEETSQEAVGETHVYQLPGRLTIEPNVPVTTALFPRTGTAFTREFVARGAFPLHGFYGPGPTGPTTVPVQVWYALKRPTRSPFGDRPLPAGTVQVYESDSAGRPQLLGEATIDHTPAGADVRLYTGDAFDVTSEWLQTDWRTEPLQRQPITGTAGPQKVTASYRATLRNAKAEAVTVDVIERHQGEWKVTESSMPSERLSAGEVRFRVPLPASGSVQLTYTIEAKS